MDQKPNRGGLWVEHARRPEEAVEAADAVLVGLGCARVVSREMLDLSAEQVGQMVYMRDADDDDAQARCYTVSRADGAQVKIIFHPNEDGTYRANVFSPAFYRGHADNHDFSLVELTDTIKVAIEGEVYK
jgi:hypothetical protein